MSVQDIAAMVAAIATGLGGVYAILKAIIRAETAELRPNGGGSIKDQVNRLETRVDKIFELLSNRSH